MAAETLKVCYNKGCGQKFDPDQNKEDSCTFHPGAPVFHDAYKSWSCCNKKSTDFTEFLNYKGCSLSFHNPVKPVEVKPIVDKSTADEVIEYRAPIRTALPRADFDSPQVIIEPKIAAGLLELAQQLQQSQTKDLADAFMPFVLPPVGTACKNNSCKEQYEGPHSDQGLCTYHPGFPIFHEGMKFWSCCTKRTSDFDEFLKQKGCETGRHCWDKKKSMESQVKCRYDWHQTGTHVAVAVYAKKYDPSQSSVKLSSVRLSINLYFPEEGGSFNLDIELGGVVDVTQSTASMMGTKLEVSLRKAEPGSWTRLFFPRTIQEIKKPEPSKLPEDSLKEDFESVDLSDL
ncbi:Hypothetical predicted protein [Cloeon dipterum]|uniref:CS domain-containing protein n=1 Tax=Cloeon dipterum TaxID=197152 RepID=A0A8S1DPQ4_9INSE|nr:Hypothetical predicted protein [Cloeon dipterum]